MNSYEIDGVKTIFLPAKSDVGALKVVKKLDLPKKKIGLVSTIQFLDQLEEVRAYLEKRGFEAEIGGQVIGCNVSNVLKTKSEVYVYIGSGEFHPLEIVEKTKKEVYVVNPLSGKFSKLTKKDLEALEKKKRGKIAKFLHSEKIGVLVSTKPGQENLKSALNLVKKLKKEAHVFVVNEVDVNKLEDFNDIEFWVNTACPRIEGKNVISLRDVLGYVD